MIPNRLGRVSAGRFPIGLIVFWPLLATPAQEVEVSRVPYSGWNNNLRLSNGTVELIMTLDVGPRIIRYGFIGKKNAFKEYADQMGKAGESEWMIRGGHRLWTAPEDTNRTYALDNSPIQHEITDKRTVRLLPAEDKPYGVRKEIEVALAPRGTRVTVTHRIRNTAQEPTRLAPWAITVMAPGGIEIIPLPDKRPHPGSPKNAKSPADFAPNQALALWSYFDFRDPRYTFGSRYILLKQDATRGPTKIGLALRLGWAAYWNDGLLFVKRFNYSEGRIYPDFGVNYETFTNEDMLEMETLGPLTNVKPGGVVQHVERWELFAGVPPPSDEAAIDRHIRPLAEVKPAPKKSPSP